MGCGLWLTALPGHVLEGAIDGNGPSNPLHKQVTLVAGGWLTAGGRLAWTLPAAAVAALGLLGVAVLRARRLAFVASALAVMAIVFTAGFALFPFLLPSASDPSQGPDRVGCVVQPQHAGHDAVRHGRAAAVGAGLQHLGVPGDARAGHARARRRIRGGLLMWYFTWILGLAFASTFAILNAMWFEVHEDQVRDGEAPVDQP